MITKQRGFNLIEVIIALVMMVGGSLALLQLQIDIEKRVDHAQRSIEAANRANDHLEWLMTRGTSVANANFVPANYEHDLAAGEFQILDDDYHLHWSIVDVQSDVKQVIVKSAWLDREQRWQEVKLVTIISQYSEFVAQR
ncbi:hypothetical protein BCU68_07860 [Vibrio sp. 10N.286.49.B3]|uniref:type IV pilus modification PilV family protein n=1 Tax=Vibrio sp. 10N.286.49.B3 TaxID=1880855 RepID=UPI000C8682ED|nr:prepilin-type N-terminal cleavage/methylation domain-containing protein [Vibrio sp. 10N.286.49.B3]PMH37521.1 hypothetical protein BCU68_07860 [Vibrio sp. 10N.286.49.B3]